MEKTVYMVNLGCPKNLVDGEVMLGLLAREGYTISLDPEQAGVLMVNTCSFINEAKEESIAAILDLARYKEHTTKHSNSLSLGVCLSAMGRNYANPSRKWMSLSAPESFYVSRRFSSRNARCLTGQPRTLGPLTFCQTMRPRGSHPPPFTPRISKLRKDVTTSVPSASFRKLEDYKRVGPIDSLVTEAAMLAAQGVKELNLIAQDLTAYGRERRDGTTLLSLLRALSTVEGIAWIRLLYCYPNYLDEPLLRTIAEEEKVCPYIDMPLQHISDRMLRTMRREKSGDGIRRLLDRIRTQIPGVVLRTSFIVGFPGEQEEDFQQLLDFVDEAQIDHVGVFRYSQEEGTTAGTLPNQVPDEVKQERWQRLMERQAVVVRRKNLALIGSEQQVLVCGHDDRGRLWGRTSGQAPDIDGVVYLNRDSG